MKRSLAKILVAAVVFVVTLLVGGIVSKKTKASERSSRISTLPDFTLPSVDGYLFNTGEISEGSVLIIYFHPECEHCQYEISSLVKSNIPESGVKILLISDAGSQQIKSFLEQFDIK
jgi:cytochrome oxidase Cu insertion factor (SCO1/SenC/PrrC family)